MATQEFIAGSGDCYGSHLGFASTGPAIAIGDIAAAGANGKAWVPFVVPIRKGTQIGDATLKVIASSDRSGTTVKVLVGCEAADNPSTPISWADLDARVMTTARLTDNNVVAWTEGNEYTFDITAAVQEVLDRAGWVYGNTLAVLIHDNGSTTDVARSFATSEHATYAEAVLSLDYVPQDAMLSAIWESY